MIAQSKNIQSARSLVTQRLRQLSRGNGKFQETYLFRDNKFEGIRFEQGMFNAIWRIADDEIRIFREEQQILVLPLSQSELNSAKAA